MYIINSLKTPENFLASSIFNNLQNYVPPKINDLQTFPEFSVNSVTYMFLRVGFQIILIKRVCYSQNGQNVK